jgi:hypothetical protein
VGACFGCDVKHHFDECERHTCDGQIPDSADELQAHEGQLEITQKNTALCVCSVQF